MSRPDRSDRVQCVTAQEDWRTPRPEACVTGRTRPARGARRYIPEMRGQGCRLMCPSSRSCPTGEHRLVNPWVALTLQCSDVRVHHDPRQFGGMYGSLPPQQLGGLARITYQRIHLGGSQIALVKFHMLLPVESGMFECGLGELAHGVTAPRGENEVGGLGSLQHPPHPFDVLRC